MNYFEEIMNETVLSWNGQRLVIVDRGWFVENLR